ncbi:hypothetical protein D3C77_719800 [compost metagenome]
MGHDVVAGLGYANDIFIADQQTQLRSYLRFVDRWGVRALGLTVIFIDKYIRHGRSFFLVRVSRHETLPNCL